MKKTNLLLLTCLLPVFASAVVERDTRAGCLLPGGYNPVSTSESESPYDGMLSNSVTQFVPVIDGDTLVFVSNGYGVLRSDDLGRSFVTYTDSCGIPRGGVSALAANASLLVCATIIDTSIADVQGAGGGIAYSLDHGDSWTLLDQPLDCFVEAASGSPVDRIAVDCVTGDTLYYMDTPVTTTIQNITWSLACEGDSAFWAASFAGGFRRYSLATGQWHTHVVDHNRFQPVDNLNHRAFSVLTTTDGIWAGSAGGVNYITWEDFFTPGREEPGDGWRHFEYQEPQLNGVPTVTGNWVVTMDLQIRSDGSEVVWVAGWRTYADIHDYMGLTWTEDGGQTWHEVEDMREVKIWDLAFNGDNIWVAAEDGLYKSNRDGEDGSWDLYGPIRDTITGREMIYEEAYAVEYIAGKLLVGGSRGVFVSEDNGASWHSTNHEPQQLLFAPNPFSPEAFGKGYIAMSPAQDERVTIRIYDFAMEQVAVIANGREIPGGLTTEIYWDGSNQQGDRVANGVYFYHVESPSASTWGKIMVIR